MRQLIADIAKFVIVALMLLAGWYAALGAGVAPLRESVQLVERMVRGGI